MPNIPHRRSLLGTGFAGLASWLWLGCAAPTEIRLNVYTDVPCANNPEWKGIAVYVGSPDSNLENKAPALTSNSCDHNGQIGSLVIVPSGSNDEEVGLRVVAGIAQNPEDCASHQYKGCIVARRSVHFNPHATLDLDITLAGDCRGIGCDAQHSCIDGTCAETRAIDDVAVVPLPIPDAATATSSVRCGDNGVYCPTTGNVCCLTVDANAGTTSGECKDPAHCASTNVVLFCDESSDCTDLSDDQGTGMCVVSYTGSDSSAYTPKAVAGAQCVAHGGTHGVNYYGLELCQDRLPCRGGIRVCQASSGDPLNPLPGYFWCTYDVGIDE